MVVFNYLLYIYNPSIIKSLMFENKIFGFPKTYVLLIIIELQF